VATNDENHDSKNDALDQAKQIIHTRKFRMHCNHILSKELDKLACILLQDLVRFQDKKFKEDPVKAKARRRYVVGLREATKYMKVSKVDCLIVAPDIENIQSKGGLNDMIGNLIKMAENTGEYGEKKRIPVFYVMNRYNLGKAILRNCPIACVAVLNYQGSDDSFKAMVEMLPNLKDVYQDKLNDAIRKINYNLIKPSTIDKYKQDVNSSNESIKRNIVDSTVDCDVINDNIFLESTLKHSKTL
jgi:ribosomal protein L7Ae-like RNA K-turn-binding protein